MKSKQLWIREISGQLDAHDSESIFMKMHESREGKRQPIVSMGDDHLLNTIRLKLIKRPESNLRRLEEGLRAEFLAGYAEPDMPENQRISLGLRRMSEDKAAKVNADIAEILDTAKILMLNKGMENAQPYLIVALCRDTTFAAAREIVLQATGINQRVELPQYTSYPTLTEEQVLELTGGHPLDSNDYGDLGFIGNPSNDPFDFETPEGHDIIDTFGDRP